jgi:hypothetical protein
VRFDKPNPFREFDLAELAQACIRAIAAFEALEGRTRNQRRVLVRHLRHLMIIVAQRIEPPRHFMGTPETLIHNGQSIEHAFRAWYAEQCRQARSQGLNRAADIALGGRAHQWMHSGPDAPYYAVLASEQRFLELLADLARLAASRAPGAP